MGASFTANAQATASPIMEINSKPSQAAADHLARLKAQDAAMVAGLKGQLNSVMLPPSPLLGGKSVKAWVYLPQGYADSKVRYPVAYLLHGAPGQGRDWFVETQAQRVAETLVSDQKAAPFIIVTLDAFGPGGLNDVQNYLDRTDGSYSMESFITKTLVPWVDGHFRTQADAYSRALVGFSSGGYGATNLGFKHPDIWRVIASISGFFDPSDDAEAMIPILGPKSKLWDENSPLLGVRDLPRGARLHFFMTCGTDDELFPEFKKMEHKLRSRGIDYEAEEGEGDHKWDYVHDRLYDVFKFCDRRWKELAVSK